MVLFHFDTIQFQVPQAAFLEKSALMSFARVSCLLVGHYCQIRQSGSHLLSLPLLPDRPQTRSWCVTTLQALNRCQMAIGTAQMVY